jgi:hypothetical protein
MSWLTIGTAILVAVVSFNFLLTPAGPPLEPWTPPVPRPEATIFKTLTAQVVADQVCDGPHGLAVDAAGRVYAACRGGQLVMLGNNAATYSVFEATIAEVFQLGFGPLGGLVVAAGSKGPLQVGGKPEPTPINAFGDRDDAGTSHLVTGIDDLKLTPEILFVDASDHRHRPQVADALIEHAGRGSLYRYNLRTLESQRLLEGLQTPLAVAVGPDDAYALVAETGAYRILRYWMAGNRSGSVEVFAENLPGFVTALSFNGYGRFWATIAVGRHALFDGLAEKPGLRRFLARMPWAWWPLADDSRAVAFDTEGHIVDGFRLQQAAGIGRMTGVVEHGPWLWIGSDRASGIARVPLQSLIASSSPPEPGWEHVPRAPKALSLPVEKDND